MPDLRIVSEQSAADAEKNRQLERLDYDLRELAANLLRVIRGAGRPEMLLPQMVDCIETAERYRAACGYYPASWEIATALALHDEGERLWDKVSEVTKKRWREDGTFDRLSAEYMIARGALQIIASRFLGQRSQLAAGESEFIKGIHDRENAVKELPLLVAKSHGTAHSSFRRASAADVFALICPAGPAPPLQPDQTRGTCSQERRRGPVRHVVESGVLSLDGIELPGWKRVPVREGDG